MFKNATTGPTRQWDEITSLVAEEITLILGTLRAERRAFMQYQKARAEIERRARVLRAYQWMDHRAKVARTEAQIVDQARCGKERATREAGVTERNRVDV